MSVRSILTASFLSVTAAASADFTLTSTYTYSVTGDVGTAYLRDVEFVMEGGNVDGNGGWGVSTSFFNNLVDDGSQASNAGTLSVSYDQGPEPFLRESLLFGIMQGFPTDGSPEQKHLVLFMDPTSASNVKDIAFGTVFPTTNEDALIGAIEFVHEESHSDAEKEPYYETIHAFWDAARNALAGSNPEPQRSAWFAGGGDFSIVAFSDGKTVGSGTNRVTVVPEPASLVALGVGAASMLRRRKGRS